MMLYHYLVVKNKWCSLYRMELTTVIMECYHTADIGVILLCTMVVRVFVGQKPYEARNVHIKVIYLTRQM